MILPPLSSSVGCPGEIITRNTERGLRGAKDNYLLFPPLNLSPLSIFFLYLSISPSLSLFLCFTLFPFLQCLSRDLTDEELRDALPDSVNVRRPEGASDTIDFIVFIVCCLVSFCYLSSSYYPYPFLITL